MEETKYYCPDCGAELTIDEDARETWFDEEDILMVENTYYCDECEDPKLILTERYQLSLIDSATRFIKD